MPGTGHILGSTQMNKMLSIRMFLLSAVYLWEEQTHSVNSCMVQPYVAKLRGTEWCREKMLGRSSYIGTAQCHLYGGDELTGKLVRLIRNNHPRVFGFILHNL